MHLPSLVNLIPFPLHFFMKTLTSSCRPSRTSSTHLLPLALYHVIWRQPSSNLSWKSHHSTKIFLKTTVPFLNLPFLSKILEKVVLHKLLSHLQENNLSNPFQSAYRAGYSTETILLRIVNDILSALEMDNGPKRREWAPVLSPEVHELWWWRRQVTDWSGLISVWEVWLKPLECSRLNAQNRVQTGEEDLVVNSVKSGRKIKQKKNKNVLPWKQKCSPLNKMHRQQLELLLTDDLLHWGKQDALDNWGHKTPTQSKKDKGQERKVKGSWPETRIQNIRLQYVSCERSGRWWTQDKYIIIIIIHLK